MPSVTFIYPEGEAREIDIPVGTSVIHSAISVGLNGIIAECGGEMVCATCHVYVLSHLDQVPQKTELEDEMLNYTADDRQQNSRLSCQLRMTYALDGLVVKLPKAQV